MDSRILAETQAFITKQREALVAQREQIFTQQHELERQLVDVNDMLAKFDAFEGKSTAPRATRARSSSSRRNSKRDGIMEAINANPGGLTRAELLDRLGVKGDKSGEMSVSNALTGLSKANKLGKQGNKYVPAEA